MYWFPCHKPHTKVTKQNQPPLPFSNFLDFMLVICMVGVTSCQEVELWFDCSLCLILTSNSGPVQKQGGRNQGFSNTSYTNVEVDFALIIVRMVESFTSVTDREHESTYRSWQRRLQSYQQCLGGGSEGAINNMFVFRQQQHRHNNQMISSKTLSCWIPRDRRAQQRKQDTAHFWRRVNDSNHRLRGWRLCRVHAFLRHFCSIMSRHSNNVGKRNKLQSLQQHFTCLVQNQTTSGSDKLGLWWSWRPPVRFHDVAIFWAVGPMVTAQTSDPDSFAIKGNPRLGALGVVLLFCTRTSVLIEEDFFREHFLLGFSSCSCLVGNGHHHLS